MEGINHIFETLKNFQEYNSKIQSQIKTIADFSASLNSKIFSFVEKVNELKDLYEEVGWIEFLPFPYLFELNEIYETKKIEGVYEKLKEDFGTDISSDFEPMFDSKDFVVKRKELINNAINKHENTDYISSIPLLLIQIEGLIWDYGQNKGLVENSFNSKIKINKINGKIVVNKNGEAINWSFNDLVKELFDESKFHEKVKNDIYSPSLRHKIIHGRECEYSNELTSLLLIILLFVILERVKNGN